jgi:hypothetical protein
MSRASWEDNYVASVHVDFNSHSIFNLSQEQRRIALKDAFLKSVCDVIVTRDKCTCRSIHGYLDESAVLRYAPRFPRSRPLR